MESKYTIEANGYYKAGALMSSAEVVHELNHLHNRLHKQKSGPAGTTGSDGSLDSHRDAIIVAHGMASGNYVQTDTEMRGRIARHLEKVIRADKTMRDFLGWQENSADIWEK